DWKWQMQNRIRDLPELKKTIQLTSEEESAFESSREFFDFAVTPYYLSLISPDDPECPVRRQVIPREGELLRSKFEKEDPLAEETNMPVKGVTHRYPDRAIWYLSHNCAVFCRFCTRKRKVSKSKDTPNHEDWEQALSYFESHSEIKEVILSGGDPLSLSDNHLEYLLCRLKAIPHINHLRIHTRYPVTLPMRITDALCEILSSFYPVFLVTHFNHVKECTPDSADAIKKLVTKGNVQVLNQSVLLKGINDSVKALEDLNYKLIAMGAKPYYLHQCDEVFGSGHFRVPIETGISLMKNLRGRMSGISVPLYVVDLTGGGGKVPIPVNYLEEKNSETYTFSNFNGDFFEIGI
ncbi:MAG: KamA family radical SAM protein, partial [Leptospira sp.]|nr:KamA family radical SAM protein [Leptospira sp.]